MTLAIWPTFSKCLTFETRVGQAVSDPDIYNVRMKIESNATGILVAQIWQNTRFLRKVIHNLFTHCHAQLLGKLPFFLGNRFLPTTGSIHG